MSLDGTPAQPVCGVAQPSIRLLGVRIDALRLPDLLARVQGAVSSRTQLVVMYVNVHCLNVRARDDRYARILEQADIVYCDGTGVRVGARLGGMDLPARMTGADWIHDLCRMAVREKLRLFFLGSSGEISQAAAQSLKVRYPGLDITGALAGFEADAQVIDTVNQSNSHILLIGMGTPTQEKWIAEHAAQIDVPVIWAVGALFDFVSGQLPRGPRWMTDHGLEWLCRLVVEPRKLWRRYLLGNPLFMWRVVRTYRVPKRLCFRPH